MLPSTACEQAVAHADVSVAIGPEGGFADEEIALAVAAGWQTVSLGPRILRVETAALFLAVAVGNRSRGEKEGDRSMFSASGG